MSYIHLRKNRKKDTQNIQFDDGLLAYEVFGKGEKVVLAFHGFGQNRLIFKSLASHLGEGYCVYSFDLPYHGESQWSECEHFLTKSEFKDKFREWLDEHKISSFSLYGYSMGGKVAVTLAESFPSETENLFMVAADGLYRSPWTSILISWPVQVIFKRTIESPTFFFWLANFVKKLGIVQEKLIDFTIRSMKTRHLRAMVYYTWRNFRAMDINKRIVTSHLDKGHFTGIVILGRKDSVIKPSKIIPSISSVGLEIITLEAGHAKILEKSFSVVADELISG